MTENASNSFSRKNKKKMLVFPNNRERPTPGNGSHEAVSALNHLPEVWRGVGVGRVIRSVSLL